MRDTARRQRAKTPEADRAIIDLTEAEPQLVLSGDPAVEADGGAREHVLGDGDGGATEELDGQRWSPGPDFRYGGRQLELKRAGDKVLASMLCVVLAPLLAVIAVAIRATSRGPVLFRQKRIGRWGVPFEIVKFRTMHDDAETRLHEDPELWERYVRNDFKLNLDEDPRITRVGRFLRRTSLDELPQLLNVLRGEMSLVGPRPVLDTELESYEQWVEAYLAVYPGITGLWQVSGRDYVAYPERARLDAEYADHWSLLGDVKLLARTVPAVLRSHGVH